MCHSKSQLELFFFIFGVRVIDDQLSEIGVKGLQ
jgi:hypothetical protein